jgi:murein DD-endopeptidase MepM/ murein hydrolase activator NlpD
MQAWITANGRRYFIAGIRSGRGAAFRPSFATFAHMPGTAPSRKNRRRRLLHKLRNKYRLVLINDRTFEERFSVRLTRMNVLLLAIAAFTLHGLFVTAVIVFTPLKRYIPGYSDQETKRHAYRSTLLADSLEAEFQVHELYLQNLRNVLRGEVPVDSASVLAPVGVPSAADLAPGRADSLLRARLAREGAYDLTDEAVATGQRHLSSIYFFPPVSGIVTEVFNRGEGHFGIDVVTKPDASVKACLDGTVVFAGWTTDAGHVVHLQHANDLVSQYKHNSVLLKKVGDRVKGGEAIAIVGNSGELTSGPHLHFELWQNGTPLDPLSYMVFQ